MKQKIPHITKSDIIRIIKREFKDYDIECILSILEGYNSESERGKYRLYASILKLANGNIDLLKKYVNEANNDYRNIISLAEYRKI
ncbi:hypothetical protein [Thermospira aquatica]|uniref:Uncharacterized protein n=1 Tax=Thermospira aquatica TaxID=2828656 RepID=A0AAX3BEF9_9SPIR|nr:hypothetical protein [Thermospira aquatica]URA10625.1 hypothetical protein KDW03_02130 [Thermospira aquatica]